MKSPAFLSALCPLLLLITTTGCAPHRTKGEKIELSVFAASSLMEAFRGLERDFETLHPNVDLKMTFAGSQVLRLQIEQGASVDVFASADESHMKALIRSRHIGSSQVFAQNELVVIFPRSHRAANTDFKDLVKASRIVVGTDKSPVGTYTRQMLARAESKLGSQFVHDVKRRVASEESNVRLVRAKVAMGEADAAIVYRTDAESSDRVHAVSIPKELNVRASYLLGTIVRASHEREAAQFVAYILSPLAQETLRRHGFLAEGQ